MIRKISGYVGAYKKYAFLAPLTIVGEVIMEVLIPLVMAHIIDVGIQGDGGMRYTVLMGLLMVVMACVSLCFGALSGKFAAMAGMGFAKNVRKALFDKVQDYSFKNVDRLSTASLVTRLTTDVTNVQNAFMMLVRMAVRAPIMLICALFLSISINASLAAVFLVVIPVLAILLYLIASNAHPRFTAMLKRYDRLNARVQENLIAIRVVKAFVREDYERVKFEEEAEAVRSAQVHAEKLVILNMPIMQICMYGCIVAVLWFGGNMIAGGAMAIGELSSFISYITQILMSLMMLSMIFIMCVLSRASLVRICEALDEQIDIRDDGADPNLKVENGAIDFENVSFSYAGAGGRMTLSDVDLHIHAGETIGILGGTGSSKTTFVQLIDRLYDATEGRVLVGGHDVREYTLDNLRAGVSVVLQKNVLFSGTIRDNLRWGDEHATDEQIEQACRAAQAHDFIMSFPNGYDTVLGQGGVNVSGGQKQRLCIARALLKNPKILILDDSTSAVDTATDASIRQALRGALPNTTKLIIAQRVASVMEADRILVLDEGRVVAFAPHEQLLKESEIYREVYTSQLKGVA